MKTLVTWTDRGPRAVRTTNRSRSRGPVKTAVLRSSVPYERVILLSTDEVRLGARELMDELGEFNVNVQLHRISDQAANSYEGLYQAMLDCIRSLGDVQMDGLISAGSPKARAVWLALAASGGFQGELIQVQGESIHRIVLPAIECPVTMSQVETLREAVGETENRVIRAALKQTGYNLSQTAHKLDIDRNTLKRKMRQMGIRN